MAMRAVVVLALALWAGGFGTRVAAGAVLQVRAGEKIQEAIDRAGSGDTVQVGPGTYREDLRLPGGITLRAERGWGETRIVGTGEGPVIQCEGPDDRAIEGFTITGGPAGSPAIRVLMLQEGHTVVRDCRITDNAGDGIAATVYAPMTAFTAEENILDGNGGRGIAVEVAFARARVAGNRVHDNRRGGLWFSASEEAEMTASRNELAENRAEEGAGIAGEVTGGSVVRLVANRIIWNRARRAAGVGVNVDGGTLDLWTNDIHANRASEAFGGVKVRGSDGSAIALVNNTVAGNGAPAGGGVTIDAPAEAPARVVNCVLWANSASDLEGASATHSFVGTGRTQGAANMAAAPRFLDAENGDYRLCRDSPGVDAGESEALPPFLAIDADGSARLVGPAVDCGAYEAVPTAVRLEWLADQIDEMAAARKVSGRVRSQLRTRIGYARATLRSRYRWRFSATLRHTEIMAWIVERETGRGVSEEAAGPLLEAIRAIARQVERCGE